MSAESPRCCEMWFSEDPMGETDRRYWLYAPDEGTAKVGLQGLYDAVRQLGLRRVREEPRHPKEVLTALDSGLRDGDAALLLVLLVVLSLRQLAGHPVRLDVELHVVVGRARDDEGHNKFNFPI